MEKKLSQETISALLKLGVYQIVGGAIGVLLILWGILQTTKLNVSFLLLFAVILLFFGYSIFAV